MSKPYSLIYQRISSVFKKTSPIFKAISGIILFFVVVATFVLTFHIGGIGAAKVVSETPPIGTRLYFAATPGTCDGGGGTWTDYGAQITCLGTQTEISN